MALKGSLKNQKKLRGGCEFDLSGAAGQLILNIERERKKTKERKKNIFLKKEKKKKGS